MSEAFSCPDFIIPTKAIGGIGLILLSRIFTISGVPFPVKSLKNTIAGEYLRDVDVKIKITSANANKAKPMMYFERFHCALALVNTRLDDNIPIIHRINAEATGKAACWQGYAARLGFGITLIKNQVRAASPAKRKMIL
jgi:hypothetical protein